MNSEIIAKRVFDTIFENEDRLTELGIKSYKDFTNLLKKTIGDLGFNSGYDVATNCDKEYNEGEWLYDLVWYKMWKNQKS